MIDKMIKQGKIIVEQGYYMTADGIYLGCVGEEDVIEKYFKIQEEFTI